MYETHVHKSDEIYIEQVRRGRGIVINQKEQLKRNYLAVIRNKA